MDHPDYPNEEKGRCWTCGYLAKYRTGHNTYHEVSAEERIACSRSLFLHRLDGSSGYYDVDANPECFVRAYPIGHEIASVSPDDINRFPEIEKILHRERNCSAWGPHTPGFGPKEHREDYNMQALEQRRKEFELELFNLSQKLQTDSLQTSRLNYWATIIFGIVVVLLSAMQIGEVWYFSQRPAPIVIQMPELTGKSNSPQ